MKKIAGLAIVLIFLLSTLNGEEPIYTNSSLARLSFITGNTYIQRAADLGYEEGVVNMPLSEGDRLGTTEGRAEIYLSKGNYVRLDYNTKIDLLSLPQKENDIARVRIWSGNVYFSIKFLEREKNLEIHTSDVSIYVLEEGLYRIDVRENGETEIFVFQGIVEAAGETGSVLIKDEQRLEVINGRFTSRPTRFYAVAEDSFDRWSEYRDSQIRKRLAESYLPEELEDFEYELAAYGDWAYVPPYGHVWVPGGIDPGWRPYYYGRWTWMSLYGWTWLPYEPWGWVTFHYGRWHWSVGHGWYWIPGTMWGPGWVSWYWGYDYLGWAPLSYYGYPVVVVNNVFYGRYRDRYYPYNSRALTVIHKNQLKARNVSKVALSKESVKNLGKISLSNKSPSLRPVSSKVSIEKLEGRKVFLRKKDSPVAYKQEKPLTRNLYRQSESRDSKKIAEDSSGKIKPSQERNIIERKIGYPSSPEISVKKYSKIVKTGRSSSVFGRIYKYISGSSKYIKSGSSRSSSKGSSSKKVSSRSSSRRSSSSATRKSSSSSSTKSSGKTKKKKK